MSRPAVDQYVPTSAVAERLGVSERTVRRRIAEGRLTAYRIGPRIIRVSMREAEAALLEPIPTGGTAPAVHAS